jgi:hypothetical protein
MVLNCNTASACLVAAMALIDAMYFTCHDLSSAAENSLCSYGQEEIIIDYQCSHDPCLNRCIPLYAYFWPFCSPPSNPLIQLGKRLITQSSIPLRIESLPLPTRLSQPLHSGLQFSFLQRFYVNPVYTPSTESRKLIRTVRTSSLPFLLQTGDLLVDRVDVKAQLCLHTCEVNVIVG